MKKIGIVLTCLLALTLCGGCGSTQEDAAALQSQYAAIDTAQMEAEVTLHGEAEQRVYTLRCDYAPEKSTVTVTAPEDLAGIRATIENGTLTVQYDGSGLTGDAPGHFGPVNCLPYLLQAVAEGYVQELGRETVEDVACHRMLTELTAADGTPLQCTVWLEESTLLPRYGEFAIDGAVRVSVKMLSFSCTQREMTADEAAA